MLESMGLTHNFHGKKGPGGGLLNFLRSEGGPEKFSWQKLFASGPPYKCLGGPDAKKGALKIFATLVRGALKKLP